MVSATTVFIVGAGFSFNAGLPLAADFTRHLLDVERFMKGGPSRRLVAFMKAFVEATFDHGPSSAAKYWPELEDLFTTIDLSANTGHHLGDAYSPATLRTVRRALLVRMIRMLGQAYNEKRASPDGRWQDLEQFFHRVNPGTSAFLSLNWDTVIEQGLARTHGINSYDYGCNAIPAKLVRQTLTPQASAAASATILKPHGSVNWLYCDACRHLFWTPPNQWSKVADQLFRERDWERVREITGGAPTAVASTHCATCSADALGTRFATFSYRKALDFPMHARTWQRAEELLYEAANWVFVGYSLPAADYEFKFLLKRVQLSRLVPPNIILVTGGTAADNTRANYQRLFGPRLSRSRSHVFLEGLNSVALDGLTRLGCLN